jgi:hypothetical protein
MRPQAAEDLEKRPRYFCRLLGRDDKLLLHLLAFTPSMVFMLKKAFATLAVAL